MKRRVLLNVLAVLVMLGFAALGRWQLERGEGKRVMLEQAAAVLSAAPRPLATALEIAGIAAADADAGRTMSRVEGRGVFEPLPVLWLDNQRRGGRVGVRQYCVARVDSAAGPRALLVDLGWLPLAGDRRLPEHDCPAGEHALGGLLTAPPAVGLAMGPGLVEQAPGRWLATRIEPARIAAAWRVPALPANVLRLDPASPLGFERDLELLANTLPPEKHRGYAVQWFGLALTTLVIAVVLNLRRRP